MVYRQLFNYNFSTHMLFKCTLKKYADTFVNGKIKFSKPKVWIQEGLNGNKGQGYRLEGVLYSSSNKIPYDKNNFETFDYNGLNYYRRKESTELYCFCIFGLNSDMFREKYIDRLGKEHVQATISNNYFAAFTNCKSKDEYDKLDIQEKPSVIFIKNVHLFFEKIKNFFINLGVNKEDIIILPVNYVDLDTTFFLNINSPYELFLKNNEFSYQSEIRIVINSNNKKYINYMEKNNGIIDIGNIKNIVKPYDYYFNDLILDKLDDTILFNLPVPEIIPLTNFSFIQLLDLYCKLLNNTISYETSKENREYMMSGIEETINKKYDVQLYNIDGKINISGLKCDFNDLLKMK